MFDHTNPYALRTEVSEGMTRYFISFMDGQATLREAEVSRPVYLEFLRFVKTERNLRRWDERHTEQSDLTDVSLYDRALHKPKSVEDAAFDSLRNEKLRLAIQDLPEIQRRRIGFENSNNEQCYSKKLNIFLDLWVFPFFLH